MNPKFQPGANLKKAAAKAADAIKSKIPVPGHGGPRSPLDRAAAKAEASALLANVKKSRMGRSKEVALLEEYFVELFSRGGSFEDFAEDLRKRAEKELNRHRPVLDIARSLVQDLRPPEVRRRLRMEVLGPAQRGEINSQEAWQRTDAITGRSTLKDTGSRAPQWTFTISVSADAGFVVGGEASKGLCGLRHRNACVVDSIAIAIGLYAGGSAGGKVSVSPGTPLDLTGIAVTYTLGGAFYVGIAVSIGLVPLGFTEGPDGLPMMEWEFDGASLAISGGADIQVAIGVEFTLARSLVGKVE